MNTREACDAAGITYRQLDFWTRCGLVKVQLAHTGNTNPNGRPSNRTAAELAALPERWRNPRNPGSGTGRDYDPTEVEYLKLMAELTRAGIEPRTAARYARDLNAHPDLPISVGGQLILKIVHHRPEELPFQDEYRAAYNEAHQVDA